MRILHTADWHVGKRLGRVDRAEDHAAVLDEIVRVADEEAVDLVLVCGDLFDRPLPPVDALRLVVDALRRLATPRRPVVAVAGNHDSAELFELFALLLRDWNVHLVGELRAPEAGGVLELAAGDERALVGCFPYLREGRAIDFLGDADAWYGQYAARVAQICAAFEAQLRQRADARAVTLLAAHFTVSGVKLGGPTGHDGAPRGERLLQIGETYAAEGRAIPTGLSYVALGHIHTPQPLPGAAAPAEYAGSALELDFGEAGEPKRVVVVDVAPGERAVVRSRLLTAGRRLIRAAGSLAELEQREDLGDALLDLTVRTAGPDAGLADRVRQLFPRAIKVHADYPRAAVPGTAARDSQPWDALYERYHAQQYGAPPGAALLAAFRALYDEAG